MKNSQPQALAAHKEPPLHVIRERYYSALSDAEVDKNGLAIEGSFNFDYVDVSNTQSLSRIVSVKTTTSASSATLVNITLGSSQGTRRLQSAYVLA